MKNWIHLVLAAVVAALVGFGSAFVSSPERSARGSEGGPSAAELGATLSELKAENARLAERLASLPTSTAGNAATPGASRVQHQDLDAAIATYLAKQTGAEARDDDGVGATQGDSESAAIAERILSGAVKGDALEALWLKLRQEKRIDGVVAEIERQAALSPSNPDVQCELGRAYIQKLFDVGIGPMAGAWGEKADKAFDQALALDQGHWEARFEKAMALSNWPKFLGKQGEAVHQFELAMEQQERVAPRDEHALTYYFLGNLYDQNGDHAKALATWKRGATRFPTNEELRKKSEAN